MSSNKSKFDTGRTSLSVIIMTLMIALIAVTPSLAQRGGQGLGAKLNLSNEQRDKLQRHLKDTGQKIGDTRAQLQDARKDLFNLLGQYRPDNSRINDTIKRINGLQLRLLNIHLDSQIRLRQILTKDQFNQLSAAIEERGPRGEGGFFRGDEGPHPGDVRSLGLSQDQQDKIKQLWRSSRQTMSALRDKHKSTSESLANMYLDYNLNAGQARQKISDLGDIQLSMLKAMVARQAALRKILTEDQFNTLTSQIRDSFRSRRGS